MPTSTLARPLVLGALLFSWAIQAAADGSGGRNVILLTLDGVRTQELFGGMDPVVSKTEKDSGIGEMDVTRSRYWREFESERREALMPFFWKTLVPAGMLLGNQKLGSKVTVRNNQWFSYPGYSEILTGQPQPEVTSNDFRRYPHRTVLQYVREKLALKPTEVAQIGSWDGFKYAASSEDGAFFMNGAYDLFPPDIRTPDTELLGNLRREVLMLWEESSNDALSFRLALAYLKQQRPRLMWIGLGQTDDYAHARRYDRLLDCLHLNDGFIAELWQKIQSTDGYQDNTTLIILPDHGRGRTAKDWIDHDAGIQGSQDIWIAIIGPDTPAQGEVRNVAEVHQSDVAATLLQFLGLDWHDFNPEAGPPIPGSYRPKP